VFSDGPPLDPYAPFKIGPLKGGKRWKVIPSSAWGRYGMGSYTTGLVVLDARVFVGGIF
jgi:hypothetical protein